MYIATLRAVFVVIVCIALAHLGRHSRHAGEPNAAVKGALTSTSTILAEPQANVKLRDGCFGEPHLHTTYLLVPHIVGGTMKDPLTVNRFANGKDASLANEMCGQDDKTFAEAVASRPC